MKYKTNSKQKRQGGYSLVELTVVVTILVLLSAAVIVNFNRGERIQRLNVAADSVQSALRQMQGNILFGLEYSATEVAQDFGFEISNNGQSYTTFVEDNNSPTPNRTNLETVTFASGVTATNLTVEGVSASKIEVRFFPPFGRIKITGVCTSYNQAENVGVLFDLRLDAGSGNIITKQVEVDGITGKIEVR